MLEQGGLEWAASGATARPRSSTAGPRRAPVATPFVAKPSERSHVTAHDRLRRRRRRRRSPPRCAPTGSSTRSRTASSAATSCASRCSRPSSPTTSRCSPARSISSVDALRLTGLRCAMLLLHEVHRVRGAHEDDFEACVPRRVAARARQGRRRAAPLLHAPRARRRAARTPSSRSPRCATAPRASASPTAIQDGDLRTWARDVDQLRHDVHGKVLLTVPWAPAPRRLRRRADRPAETTSSRCSWRTPRGRTRACSTSTSRPRARTTRRASRRASGRGILELLSVFQHRPGAPAGARGRAVAAHHRLRPAQEPAAHRGAGGVPRAGHVDARRARACATTGGAACSARRAWSPLS